MRIFLHFLPLLITTTPVLACMCGDYHSGQEAFEYFDFISHVKISVEVFPIGPGTAYNLGDDTKYIGFEALDIYKGDNIGWVEESGFGTSCAMGISTGEEWILFAKKGPNGNYHISYCSPSALHQFASGLRNWDTPRANYPENLAEYCWNNIPPLPNRLGRDTLLGYYQNGNLEYMTPFLNAKRHGARQRFHPNGELAMLDYFEFVLQIGQHLVWDEEGCLSEWTIYDNFGKRIYQLNKLWARGFWNEIKYDPAKNSRTVTRTGPSGERTVTIQKNFYKLEEKQYRASGKLIFHAKYDDDFEATVLMDIRTNEEKYDF